jgi:DNA-directed RNA polymerase specialized sigma24 family protein
MNTACRTDLYEDIDSVALLRTALEKLPTNSREVLILRELDGMSYKEIADITGMPVGTVMSSLSRARGRLRHVLTTLIERSSDAKFTANRRCQHMSAWE